MSKKVEQPRLFEPRVCRAVDENQDSVLLKFTNNMFVHTMVTWPRMHDGPPIIEIPWEEWQDLVEEVAELRERSDGPTS